MKKQTKYIYISDPLFHTVKDSQVLNWLKVIWENGVVFDLVLLTRVSYVLKFNSLRKIKIKLAKSILKGDVKQVLILSNNDSTRISSLIIFFYLFGLLFLHSVVLRKKIVIQTRMSSIGKILRTISQIIPDINIIFDYRGANAEELINGLGYSSIEDVSDSEIRKKYYKSINMQLDFFKSANYVFCVSQKLKDYALSISKELNISSEKFKVIPGSADETQFFINEPKRKELRINKDIDNKYVLIYTGKLDLHWHKKESIFKLVKKLIDCDQRFFFMCITPEIELAKKLSTEFEIPSESIYINFASYEEIPQYLNCADAGIILREDIPTNKVASPTKIPEYLLCGLPVLISPNVGDYSDFIQQNNLGIIVNRDNDYLQMSKTLLNNNFDRIRIAEKGKSVYAKQRIVNTIIDTYKKLVN